MRISIDHDACTGHGRCYTVAPGLFDCDDDGHGQVRQADVPPALEDQAGLAFRNCPEDAITLTES